MTQTLEKIPGFRPVRFVGQASKGEDIGMNQREQKDIIERFQNGEFNILVATSIAEEGLDIPSTDLVVLYEPVPSEIRTIQRRGRTGRRRAGR
jgi:ERCC4-related helicase